MTTRYHSIKEGDILAASIMVDIGTSNCHDIWYEVTVARRTATQAVMTNGQRFALAGRGEVGGEAELIFMEHALEDIAREGMSTVEAQQIVHAVERQELHCSPAEIVAAFGGIERVREAYTVAKTACDYRFDRFQQAVDEGRQTEEEFSEWKRGKVCDHVQALRITARVIREAIEPVEAPIVVTATPDGAPGAVSPAPADHAAPASLPGSSYTGDSAAAHDRAPRPDSAAGGRPRESHGQPCQLPDSRTGNRSRDRVLSPMPPVAASQPAGAISGMGCYVSTDRASATTSEQVQRSAQPASLSPRKDGLSADFDPPRARVKPGAVTLTRITLHQLKVMNQWQAYPVSMYPSTAPITVHAAKKIVSGQVNIYPITTSKCCHNQTAAITGASVATARSPMPQTSAAITRIVESVTFRRPTRIRTTRGNRELSPGNSPTIRSTCSTLGVSGFMVGLLL